MDGVTLALTRLLQGTHFPKQKPKTLNCKPPDVGSLGGVQQFRVQAT